MTPLAPVAPGSSGVESSYSSWTVFPLVPVMEVSSHRPTPVRLMFSWKVQVRPSPSYITQATPSCLRERSGASVRATHVVPLGTRSIICPWSDSRTCSRPTGASPPQLCLGRRFAKVVSRRMYVSGMSQPRPTAPTPRAPDPMATGTGRPPRALGKSSGTEAEKPPDAFTLPGSVPVSEARPP
ncbi:hypothetical protein COSO111634_08275 [Corallococcus soli]